MPNRTITIITNPISGGKNDKGALAELVKAEAAANDYDGIIKYTTARGDATRFARSAIDEAQAMVVVLGGDGTINEAATALVNTNIPLGIIPLGSGNGLARTLGIPMDVATASALLFDGKIKSIDVGSINGRYFFLIAGVGFDALIGKCFDNFHTRGPLAYFYLSMREFINFQPEKVKICFNEKIMSARPFTVAVANGRQYGNNAEIAPAALLDDGLLNLVIIHKFKFWHIFTQLYKFFTSKVAAFKHAEFHQTDQLRIERNQPGVVNIDGEAYDLERVLEISLVSKGLRVIVPQNTTCFS